MSDTNSKSAKYLVAGTFLASLFIIYQIVVAIYNVYFHPLSKFPGPLISTAFHFDYYYHMLQGSPHRNLKALHDKYGSVVRYRPDSLSFNSPGAWKDIYGSHPGKGQHPKDPRSYSLGGTNEGSIIYCNDATHSRMRKLLSHAFSDTALRQQEDILTKYFELFVTELTTRVDTNANNTRIPSATVDLTKWYNFLTFDIIGDLCFGESFGATESGEYNPWMANLFSGVKYARFFAIASFYEPLWTMLTFLMKTVPYFERARGEHENYCRQRTQIRVDTKTDRKDFMTYILRHNDERGMTLDEMKSNSIILIVAGSETTATLLSGVTHLLLRTPEAYAKVKAEVRGAFASGDELTLVSTSRLTYLQACIEEAARIYPPVPIELSRVAHKEGSIIDGGFVPGKTVIAIAQYAAYHSATNFTDPESFVPERWLANVPKRYVNDKKDVMNPFSTGPRGCIGKNLAYNELRSILARVIYHFDLELADQHFDIPSQNVYFMWEKQPLNVRITRRTS